MPIPNFNYTQTCLGAADLLEDTLINPESYHRNFTLPYELTHLLLVWLREIGRRWNELGITMTRDHPAAELAHYLTREIVNG